MVRSLLRSYSILFNALFALSLLAVSAVSLLGPPNSFQLHILPWEGRKLAYAILALAVAGILVALWAFFGTARKILFLWTLLVLALIIRGFFFSPHSFVPGSGQIWTALALTLAAALAVLGARMEPRARRARR